MRTWTLPVVMVTVAALAGCGVKDEPDAAKPAPSTTKVTTPDASEVARAPVAPTEPAKPADAPPPAPVGPADAPPPASQPLGPPEPVDFASIFDGKTLDGWSAPDMGYWSVEDGAVTGRGTADKPIKKNQFLVWQQGELDDFELKLQYKITGGGRANSGVQIRSRIQPDGHAVGYQADIDFGGSWAGALYDEHGRGPLARRGQKTVIDSDGKVTRTRLGDARELFAKVKKEDWNEYHITARGARITLRINGEVMSETVDESEKDRDLVGRLALQLHSGPPMVVQFRDIRLKRLPLEGRKKIVLVAGPRSHSYGVHEHNAGWILLARLLNESTPGVHATVYRSGWPADPTAFDNANAVGVFSDGGAKNFMLPHLDQIDLAVRRGAGFACLHYALCVPKDRAGGRMLDWTGGYYEEWWSVNPTWEAEAKTIPEHPVTRGVRPFKIKDEWYYHMRFQPDMKGVTPVLTAVPPERTRQRGDGPHIGNPHVRARTGMGEHLAWAYERPGGRGRGFGFTGGHWHWNWAHDDYRRLVLNGLVWVAGAEVPEGGVATATPTIPELEADQDDTSKRIWNHKPLQKMIDRWNQP
ncbi:MAG: family 16 glycoside hydrolase [Planctomycetota bacterium]|jgi:predicted small lipoprotein YifL/type 1 glutamine amidotransferase